MSAIGGPTPRSSSSPPQHSRFFRVRPGQRSAAALESYIKTRIHAGQGLAHHGYDPVNEAHVLEINEEIRREMVEQKFDLAPVSPEPQRPRSR